MMMGLIMNEGYIIRAMQILRDLTVIDVDLCLVVH